MRRALPPSSLSECFVEKMDAYVVQGLDQKIKGSVGELSKDL